MTYPHLAWLLLLTACDADIQVDVGEVNINMDPCELVGMPADTCDPLEPIAPWLLIPRARGEVCKVSSGETCGPELICACGVCADL